MCENCGPISILNEHQSVGRLSIVLLKILMWSAALLFHKKLFTTSTKRYSCCAVCHVQEILEVRVIYELLYHRNIEYSYLPFLNGLFRYVLHR